MLFLIQPFVQGSQNHLYRQYARTIQFPRIRDRGNKTMKYIGEITINDSRNRKQKKPFYNEPRMPQHIQATPDFVSAKNILDTKGAEGVVEWIGQKNVLLTIQPSEMPIKVCWQLV